LLITCYNYELENRLIKPEIRFPNVKNMGRIYSPMAFESSKDFKVGCQFLFIEIRLMCLDCNCILHDILCAAVNVDV
jgi:hypothetical protein